MVKITDPTQNNKPPEREDIYNISRHSSKNNLTPETITELMKPAGKPETTQLNIRIEKDLNDQIDAYAKEHGTTKTTILTDIINRYYTDKRITKGSFTLNIPVTLRIPRNKQVIKEYITEDVNLIGNNIEIKPNVTDKTNRNKYQEVTITQGNNLYDEYNTTHEYYYFKSLSKYMDKFYGSLYHLILEKFIDEKGNAMSNELLHRGLTLVTITTDEEEVIGLFIDVIYMGNEMLGAYIIDPEDAISVAEETGNRELIQFIKEVDTYLTLSELVEYTRSNKEYKQELKLMNDDLAQLETKLEETLSENKELKDKNTELEEELKILDYNRTKLMAELENKTKDVYIDEYIKLEEENKKLHKQIQMYRDNEKIFVETMNMVKQRLLNNEELLKNYLEDRPKK